MGVLASSMGGTMDPLVRQEECSYLQGPIGPWGVQE